jgi:hypothetical protein
MNKPDAQADQPGLMPYPHHVGSAPIVPNAPGAIRHQALEAMREQTDAGLAQIKAQLDLLAQQAQAIQLRRDIAARIFAIPLSFKPEMGHSYHLYRRSDGSRFLSMVGPREWGRSRPELTFEATVRLLSDHTWEVLEGTA